MKKFLVTLACLLLSAMLGSAYAQGEFAPREFNADADQVRSICISAIDRSVDVSLSPDDGIHLSCYESDKEYYAISVDDGVLTVELLQDKRWYDYIGGKSPEAVRSISLQVPADLLDSLTIATTNEPVALESISVLGSIDISVNGGDITFDALNAGKQIALECKNGDISGTICGLIDDYSIQTRIKKGDSNLPESMGDGGKVLSVAANNGNIDISFE